jgi:hypothetical protein
MTTHGAVAGSMRRTIEGLREANAGLVKANREWQDKCLAMQTGRDAALVHGPEDMVRALEEQRTLIETLERRIKGLHVANNSFGDVIARVEAVLALHRPGALGNGCRHCLCAWPCPTRRALEGKP